LAIIIITVVFAILAPLFARILYFALSRRREYLADAGAVRLTRYPEGLAGALEKISQSAIPMTIMAVRRMVFGKFDVKIIGDQLEGNAWGEPLDLPRHKPALEVKAATYHELKVYKDEAERWIAQCVVDV
jgi:Zn-dependent protease with chaperone function